MRIFTTYEERQLMAIYNSSGTRKGLIDELGEMRTHLTAEEKILAELTDSAIEKLNAMTDEEYEALDLYPDFDSEDENEE